MLDHTHPIAQQLLQLDKRYRLEAYAFVFEALTYAHDVLGMGTPQPRENLEHDPDETVEVEEPAAGEPARGKKKRTSRNERHLTGQELCEAIRRYALDQFGMMAKCVLNGWGVTATGDFGNIVFNLIEVGQMKKTKKDRREDFDGVFDFDAGLVQNYRIKLPKSTKKA